MNGLTRIVYMPMHKSTVPGKFIAVVHGKSGKLSRLCKVNCHGVKLTRHALVYMCVRWTWSCAAPAGMTCRLQRCFVEPLGDIFDACMQHCMKRFWSIQYTCHESQYRWSLPSAMLAVYSGCKQFAAMHACSAFSTIAILINALQQLMSVIERYL